MYLNVYVYAKFASSGLGSTCSMSEAFVSVLHKAFPSSGTPLFYSFFPWPPVVPLFCHVIHRAFLTRDELSSSSNAPWNNCGVWFSAFSFAYLKPSVCKCKGCLSSVFSFVIPNLATIFTCLRLTCIQGMHNQFTLSVEVESSHRSVPVYRVGQHL
jgi:hypothetical protein